jgi:hypothetical protein
LAHANDILRFITYVDMDFVIRKWVHYYRLQNSTSCPFILAALLSKYISVGIVNRSRTGHSKCRYGTGRDRDPSRLALEFNPSAYQVRILSVNFEVDFGSGLRWG